MAMNKIIMTETKEVLEENVPEEETVRRLSEWELFFHDLASVMALPMEGTTYKAA